jgi:hypothetical protein
MKALSMPDGVWFHVVLTFHGNWLPGDPRGFRTRKHRDHIEGDYKNPPEPGTYDALFQMSKENLDQEPVLLAMEQRILIGKAMLQRFEELGGLVGAIAVAGSHVHLLAKYPMDCYRVWTGLVKKHAWFVLKAQGHTSKLWGKRGKELQIRNQSHFENARKYIADHEKEGAWVWG